MIFSSVDSSLPGICVLEMVKLLKGSFKLSLALNCFCTNIVGLQRYIIIIIIRQFVRHRNIFVKSLQGRHVLASFHLEDLMHVFRVKYVMFIFPAPPFPFGCICFVVLVMRKRGESS